MAVELEQTIMQEIGLGNNFRWFNGSESCGYIRQKAVDILSNVAGNHGLSISEEWLQHCRTAIRDDQLDGDQYTLTNTWLACYYAVHDAIYRKYINENPEYPDWALKAINEFEEENYGSF